MSPPGCPPEAAAQPSHQPASTHGLEIVHVPGMSVHELKRFISSQGGSLVDCYERTDLEGRASECLRESRRVVGLEAASIKQLKQFISAQGMSHADCYEKDQLISRAREVIQRASVNRAAIEQAEVRAKQDAAQARARELDAEAFAREQQNAEVAAERAAAAARRKAAKDALYCTYCKKQFKAASTLQEHCMSKKHKDSVEAARLGVPTRQQMRKLRAEVEADGVEEECDEVASSSSEDQGEECHDEETSGGVQRRFLTKGNLAWRRGNSRVGAHNRRLRERRGLSVREREEELRERLRDKLGGRGADGEGNVTTVSTEEREQRLVERDFRRMMERMELVAAQRGDNAIVLKGAHYARGNSKALPANFTFKQAVADNAQRREQKHHGWGQGGVPTTRWLGRGSSSEGTRWRVWYPGTQSRERRSGGRECLRRC
eukprot:TRINITY_DN22637_c0_g1_i2.p1 TRINITY_DN22637_c0_g1~~TRINITY_DN22637_c0_g1_i2.p1  ORF type:complete len:433 (-),score=103.83 TRINITY_DN22637_c0_g1_i2:547-1845(-)